MLLGYLDLGAAAGEISMSHGIGVLWGFGSDTKSQSLCESWVDLGAVINFINTALGSSVACNPSQADSFPEYVILTQKRNMLKAY